MFSKSYLIINIEDILVISALVTGGLKSWELQEVFATWKPNQCPTLCAKQIHRRTNLNSLGFGSLTVFWCSVNDDCEVVYGRASKLVALFRANTVTNPSSSPIFIAFY